MLALPSAPEKTMKNARVSIKLSKRRRNLQFSSNEVTALAGNSFFVHCLGSLEIAARKEYKVAQQAKDKPVAASVLLQKIQTEWTL